MSVGNRYWSFKLLLQETQQHDGEYEAELAGAPATRSLLSAITQPPRPTESAKEDDPFSEYGEFEPADRDRMTVAPTPPLADVTPLVDPEPRPVFVPPTEKELDLLSVAELRRLRRQIALQIHPDRGDARSVHNDQDAMGRCNQLIDAAIKRKVAKIS